MKWEKPKLHDLQDLKKSVAQGACSIGAVDQDDCAVGGTANACAIGDLPGSDPSSCSGGSADG
jgi:hypothetical protein